MTNQWAVALAVLVVVLAVGSLTALGMGLFRDDGWAWWQVLLAIPALGLGYLALEALVEWIQAALGADRKDAPRWRQYLGLFVGLVVVFGILGAAAWVHSQFT